MTQLPITEPGVYRDISMDDYHGQLTATPSISSSGLRLLDGKSPAHWFAQSYMAPKDQDDLEKEAKRNAALSLGSAAHALVLGDEAFNERHVLCPFPDFKKKVAGEWRDEQLAAGKIIVTQKEMKRVHGMAKRLNENHQARALLDGEIERTLVWRDEETGVWLKARPDVLPRAGIIADYKTTEDASREGVIKSVFNFGYNVQLALILEGLVSLGVVPADSVNDHSFVLVAQEKEAPFAVNVVELDPEWIFRGAQIVRRAVRKFAQCLADNVWPEFEPSLEAVRPAAWMSKRWNDQEEYGDLPKPSPCFLSMRSAA